jgi:opacity protein-like surface antigen
VFLALFVSTKINAQSFRFGIHATPSINYIETDNDDASNDVGLKFGFGLLAEYAFSDKYSFATGVDILRRGGELTINDTVGDYNGGFINIPLQLKMRTRQFGYFTYFANFGGGLSFKTSEKVSFSPEGIQEIDGFINPVNMTFAIGGGVEYSLGGSTSLLLGINYNRSLFNNLSDDNSVLNENSSYRFDHVGITVGIIF